MKVLALVYPGMTLQSTRRVIELIMEYAPQPPYGSGRPDLADAETLAAARAAMHQAMTGAPA